MTRRFSITPIYAVGGLMKVGDRVRLTVDEFVTCNPTTPAGSLGTIIGTGSLYPFRVKFDTGLNTLVIITEIEIVAPGDVIHYPPMHVDPYHGQVTAPGTRQTLDEWAKSQQQDMAGIVEFKNACICPLSGPEGIMAIGCKCGGV